MTEYMTIKDVRGDERFVKGPKDKTCIHRKTLHPKEKLRDLLGPICPACAAETVMARESYQRQVRELRDQR